jgi:hypothetical protein
LRTERDQCMRSYHSGRELREVVCTWLADYASGTIACVRDDTGEVVETRPLTDAERQTALPNIHEYTTGAT